MPVNTTLTLPQSAQAVIDHYEHLRFGNQNVRAAYFMNRANKKGARVLRGKGTPAEIEYELTKLAHKYNLSLDTEPKDIHTFMVNHELGIDCSGFVAWVLNALFLERHHKPLWQFLNFQMPPYKASVIKAIRPIENISVRILTHTDNSIEIKNLADIQVGDIIRTLNGHHVLLVDNITLDHNNKPVSCTYVNSTEYDGSCYGIRHGRIEFVDRERSILEQRWIDPFSKVNLTYEATKVFPQDTRVMRLRALA